MKCAITLLTIYILAVVFDWGEGLTFLIRYMLMALLFCAFLKVKKINKPEIKKVSLVLFSMFLIGFIFYFSFIGFHKEVAEAALMVALTPTALASIVITDLLGGNKGHAASNVLVTNIFIVFTLPFIIMFIVPEITLSSALNVLCSTLLTFFLPYIAALMVKQYMRKTATILNSVNVSFYVWAFLMYLSISKSVYFIKHTDTISNLEIISLALIVLILCIINFTLGKFIGGKKFNMETSLALGHKNNGFAVWFSLTFIDPFVALGPAMYVLFQNLYLIFVVSKSKK